jgi:hypothetical protein
MEAYEAVFAEGATLVLTEDIPEDVTPIQLEGPEEALTIVAQLKAGADIEVGEMGAHRVFMPVIVGNDALLQSSGVDSPNNYIITRRCTKNAGTATFFVQGNIELSNSGAVVRVPYTGTGLSGFTYGLGLSDQYSYSYNLSPGRVSVAGGGQVNAYLLINTTWTILYSTRYSCNFTYSR